MTHELLVMTSGLALACFGGVCFGGEELKDTDQWAGRPRHLAVVNPPVTCDDGNTISLRGTWEFSSFPHNPGSSGHLAGEMFPNGAQWGAPSCWQKNLTTIEVPGCWQAQPIGQRGKTPADRVGNSAGKIRNELYGNGLYRRTVTIPAAWKGRRVWLKVGRLCNWGWIWFGKPRTVTPQEKDWPTAFNGYLNRDDIDGLTAVAHTTETHRALKWEITDLVTAGETYTLMVQVNNTYPARNVAPMSFCRWGGIVRDIELESTPAVFIDDAWVRGDFDRRVAEVHVAIGTPRQDDPAAGSSNPPYRLRVTIEGAVANQTIQQSNNPTIQQSNNQTIQLPLRNFRAWHPETPNLYTAKVEIVAADGRTLQTRYERFGVRKFEVRGKEFYLNGRPFQFRGFGDDYTYPIHGFSPASKEFHLGHFRIARRAGFNYVRLHTHCEIPEYFDAADEAGIIVQPELSYNGDTTVPDVFTYDILGDARAIWEACRRHPSFGIYSGGNEGVHGVGARLLCQWVHTHDPDRLVIEQDGGTYAQWHRADTSDFASGPVQMWERGTFNPRAFICHEYANLCVKCDARGEDDYTGAWLPRMTRAARRRNLAPAGLGEEWGDRLQDAQNDLQRFWGRCSIECARKDPFCDGYVYWTIADYTHFDKRANTACCQGMFDPFWKPRRHGATPESVAVVNSPSVILLDTEDRVRTYDRQPKHGYVCCAVPDYFVIDETNRCYAAGERIPAEFIFQHYGLEDLAAARLEWKLATADGRVLASGSHDVGAQRLGPARTLAKDSIAVPALAKPTKAILTATVTANPDGGGTPSLPTANPDGGGTPSLPTANQDGGGTPSLPTDGRVAVPPATAAKAAQSNNPTFKQSNNWTFWLFPKAAKPSVPADVVVADFGSAEAEAARKAGKSILLVGNRRGLRDIFLGWWAFDWRAKGETQCGVAVKEHALFRDFPYEPYLSPLLFNIIGQGTPLPVAGFGEKDFIMVGEGIDDFKLYLAAKVRPDGGREVFVSGLDVFADRPEARTLLNDIFGYLK